MIECRYCIDRIAALADRHHQFDFVMKVRCERWVWDYATALHQCISWFGKEDRRLALGIVAHLADMIGVVAAHAEDTPNGESRIASDECDAGSVRRIDDIRHVA